VTLRLACIALVLLAFAPARPALAQTAAPPNPIKIAHAGATSMLTDTAGFTLYVLDADTPGTSTCNGTCAQNWPPLTAAADARPDGAYTIVTRADGTRQWAVNGKPLYRFKNDAQPGATKGDGVAGRWHVATPGELRTIGHTTVIAKPAYTARTAVSATKTDTPLMQTPVDIQVVTQQVLQDQQVISIKQAVQNVSGVTVGAGGAADDGQPFSSVVVRGFSTDSHFRDGARLDSFGGDSDTYSLQLANVESVEVLKGPAAILYGAVEPGGIVDIVTKQPLSTPYFAYDQQAGSYDLTRSSIDASGPLTSDGKLLYRLNASLEYEGSPVKFAYDNNAFVAPVLRWNADASTQLTFEYEYHHLNLGQYFGFEPLLNGVPLNPSTSVNYGGPSPDVEITNLFAFTLAHRYVDGWSLRQKFVLNTTGVDGAGLFPFYINSGVATASGWGVGRFINNVVNADQTWSSTTDFTRHVGTGPLTQTLLFGGDFVHFGAYGNIYQAGQTDGNISYVDLFAPVNPGTPFTGPTTPLIADAETNVAYGLYAQDQLKLGNVNVLAGARYQNIHQTSGFGFAPAPPASSPTLATGAVTPRFGLLWQPENALSLYGNYTENFGPNQAGDITITGATVPPTRGRQWEIGAKTATPDGRLSATLAYFDLVKTNIPTPDLANPAFVDVTGAARSTGVEFDLQGQIAPRWQAIANYDVTDAAVTQSNDPNNPVGAPLGEVPHDRAHLWLAHEFQAPGHGLKIGGGVTFNSAEPYLYAGTNNLNIPAYAVVDAMLSDTYTIGRTTFRPQVNVTNLLNRRYLSDAQNPGFPATAPYSSITALYGAPREFTAEFGAQF
jgi:iron complex outermembrane receptor protein